MVRNILIHSKGETKPEALEILTYFQFFMCNRKDFFSSRLDLSEEKRKKKNQNFSIIILVAVGIAVVVVYSFHHCSPSKTTVKA